MIKDAYSAEILGDANSNEEIGVTLLIAWFGNLDLFDRAIAVDGIELAGDGTCLGDDTPTPEPTSTSEGGETGGQAEGTPAGAARAGGNPEYRLEVSGTSGSVEVNANDCYLSNGLSECAPGGDITGLEWEPADGGPDLVKFTLSFAGSVLGPANPVPVIRIIGSDGSGVMTRVSVSDGAAVCDHPLLAGGGLEELGTGESCEVNAAGEIEFVRDLSRMPDGAFMVSIFVSHTPVGGVRTIDSVDVAGIER